MVKIFSVSIFITICLFACSPTKQLAKQTDVDLQALINDSALSNAHVGVCVYDATGRVYVHQYQAEKYFVPASNTKLFTCYAAMKYLGDSLVGLRYQSSSDTAINISPTGDPTFMHPDFTKQPVMEFLTGQKSNSIYLGDDNWKSQPFGKGWSWDDYNDDYMAERSPMPVYGNTVRIKLQDYRFEKNGLIPKWAVTPDYFRKYLDTAFGMPLKMAASLEMKDSIVRQAALVKFGIKRNRWNNDLDLEFGSNTKFSQTEIPFYTDIKSTTVAILQNLGIKNIRLSSLFDNSLYGQIPFHLQNHTIYSQPTDSLLKITMHRSDNFFAEQSLLMVSNEKLGYMSDVDIIDTLLKTDLKDLPQPPTWVDGSGLSRYNLFTPQDFVKVLEKMKDEFGMTRMKTILATGGEGTISSYYQSLSGKIFAKTGTLSGQVALSGYLYTKAGKLLMFSILVNNHHTSSTKVRKAVERYVMKLYLEV